MTGYSLAAMGEAIAKLRPPIRLDRIVVGPETRAKMPAQPKGLVTERLMAIPVDVSQFVAPGIVTLHFSDGTWSQMTEQAFLAMFEEVGK